MKWHYNENKNIRIRIKAPRTSENKTEGAVIAKIDQIGTIEIPTASFKPLRRKTEDILRVLENLLERYDIEDYLEDAGYYNLPRMRKRLSDEEIEAERKRMFTEANEALKSDIALEFEDLLGDLLKGRRLYEIEYFRKTYWRGPGDGQKLIKSEPIKVNVWLEVSAVERCGSPYKAYLEKKMNYAES